MKNWGFGRGVKSIAMALSLTASAASQAFDQMFVFGDSLSDIGNDLLLTKPLQLLGVAPFEVPPKTRYYDGRFSDGPVWHEFLASDLGIKKWELKPSLGPFADPAKHSLVYAYGGSGTYESNPTPGGFEVRGLVGQVNDFIADSGNVADPEALYVIWSGANDYLLADAVLPSLPETDNPAEPTITNIVTAIMALREAGAQSFLVLNLADLGSIPAAADLGVEAQAGLSAITAAHNATLAEALQALPTDITLDLVDVYGLVSAIATGPSAFGFDEDFSEMGPAAGCLIAPPLADCSAIPLEADGHVFWDEQHPTSNLHQLIGFKAAFCLDAPGSCRLD